MDQLIEIGFIKTGFWTLHHQEDIRCTLIENQSAKNLLYCFVSQQEIKYIGKTIKTLSQRMYGYQRPGISQSTNINVKKEIISLLKEHKEVEIFILINDTKLKYGNFNINIAAGLEDTLIEQLSPPWNKVGKSKKLTVDKTQRTEITSEPISNISELSYPIELNIRLGEAYYNQGFFNIGVKYSDKLHLQHGTLIHIQLGSNSSHIIEGYINRTANSNKTPRIMGGKALNQWIQRNFNQDSLMKIHIVNNTYIKLEKQTELSNS
ncbi:hypothetical protein C5B41_03230 [Acinetobacter ursingii]|uniref:GIY-YIG nuclease family protein n=1 Tax=Acinetobacter ursingii TaxID=108980 RepID=UPI000CF29A1A|nr:GIY-YIG nuclease family protein [Acinetobacter ursingii]MCU4487747.1 GIY-YIG nuclease family protein [Acinetobacter ursingii]MCU4602669.1 GIY-YIG nuclease family protein [Acinetobacter ursingii]PPZ95680.1 hypothetical protein C5B41_03230 [Acinetobacter ursingii]